MVHSKIHLIIPDYNSAESWPRTPFIATSSTYNNLRPGTLQAAAWRYQSLDERLFDKYIEEKANPISGVLEQNMYSGLFDWNLCPKPKGKIQWSLIIRSKI